MMGAVARLGITLPLRGMPLPAQREVLPRLLDAGYTDVWAQETAGLDPFATLAALAGAAPRARLGVAVAGVFNRGPALLAMQAAALAELAPGRFVLGLGSSSPGIVEGWNAARFAKPVARVRDTVRFLRRALAGAKVSETYETFAVRGFQLDRPVPQPPALYAAALGPRMLRLAATEADGLCLSLLGPQDVPRLLGVAREAGPVRDVVLGMGVCPTRDAARARAATRRMLARYLTLPAYARLHDWLGRGDLLRALREAWRTGGRERAEALLPDEVLDALVVHGPIEACRERIAAFVEAGVTTPLVAVWPFGGDPLEAALALAGGG